MRQLPPSAGLRSWVARRAPYAYFMSKCKFYNHIDLGSVRDFYGKISNLSTSGSASGQWYNLCVLSKADLGRRRGLGWFITNRLGERSWHSHHHHNGWILAITRGSSRLQLSSACKVFPG